MNCQKIEQKCLHRQNKKEDIAILWATTYNAITKKIRSIKFEQTQNHSIFIFIYHRLPKYSYNSRNKEKSVDF